MSPARLLLLVRVALCAAAFASAALVIDYRNAGDPAFCAVESDCFKVRMSDEGREIAEQIHSVIPGASLPAVALAIFAGVLALTFFVHSRTMGRLLALTTFVGAAFAVFFVYVQAKLGAYCAYCMVVDVSMIVAAVGAGILAGALKTDEDVRRRLGPSMETKITLPWGIAGAVVTLLPFLWAEFPANQALPAPIQALQQRGKLTVVSFTDFQCPFCRRLHPVLKEIKARDDVVFHRYMVPLDGHPGAMPAALGYVCVPEDLREPMAEQLYTVPDTELTYEGVVRVAAGLGGVDERSFRECLTSPATKEKVKAEKKLFDDLELQGLPTTFVGKRVVKGAAEDRVRAAARTAGVDVALPVWGLWALAAAVVGAAAFLSSRREQKLADELEKQVAEEEKGKEEAEEAKAEADAEADSNEPKPKPKKKAEKKK